MIRLFVVKWGFNDHQHRSKFIEAAGRERLAGKKTRPRRATLRDRGADAGAGGGGGGGGADSASDTSKTSTSLSVSLLLTESSDGCGRLTAPPMPTPLTDCAAGVSAGVDVDTTPWPAFLVDSSRVSTCFSDKLQSSHSHSMVLQCSRPQPMCTPLEPHAEHSSNSHRLANHFDRVIQGCINFHLDYTELQQNFDLLNSISPRFIEFLCAVHRLHFSIIFIGFADISVYLKIPVHYTEADLFTAHS